MEKHNFKTALLQNQQHKIAQQLVEKFPQLFSTLSLKQQHLIVVAATLSDFVYKSIEQAPALIFALFSNDQVVVTEQPNYNNLLAEKLNDCQSEDELQRILRHFRCQEMVRIAVADMVLALPLKSSLQWLSALADCLIEKALAWLSTFCYQKWGKPLNSEGELQPLLIFAMGKLGGKELNFSSDIDLIFTYPEAGETAGSRRTLDNQQFFIRLGQKLISALHQVTTDGFVYRVDMRLRPFGESGPLVMSFNGLEDYYQEQGRDWERFAMLKARVIGDGEYQQQLRKLLKPFVYRRYIDFSVIDSLRRMKMLIAQEVRRKGLVNNIKLGAGGIRELEFIVQVFQLLRGGREPELQERNLLMVLPRLVTAGAIEQSNADTLIQAYCFLRRVENIIQAFADQQTQTLPDDELNQTRLLHILNILTWPEFLATLAEHMTAVHTVFTQLIGEDSPNHETEDEHWQLLLNSQWSATEQIEYIEQHISTWPAQETQQALADFQHDINKRSIGQRGREVFAKLLPLTLWLIEKESGDVTLFNSIALVLKQIVSRTAYLELLYENEGALQHLIKLAGQSQWLAEHIAKYPIVLDELLDPNLLHKPQALSHYQNTLQQVMLRIPEDDLEMQMNSLRQFKQAQQLRIAAGDIAGALPLMKVSDHLTALAEAILTQVINIAWQQLIPKHGQPNSLAGQDHKGILVLGYGKLGGIELGYSSDLDLVFLHNSTFSDVTDGQKPIPATQFYVKLAQKIMHIFNTRMISGILYELDLRLRPSGNSGLLMVNVSTFEEYQLNEAWTWEHQALVRVRAIYGCASLCQIFDGIRRKVLMQARSSKQLAREVTEMRQKMRSHLDKTKEESFDVKQGVGGLVDIEFLAQYLVLQHAGSDEKLTQYSDNIRIFESLLAAGIISEEQCQQLISAYCLLRNFSHRQSLLPTTKSLSVSELNGHINHVKKIYSHFL